MKGYDEHAVDREKLLVEKHAEFVHKFATEEDGFLYYATEHFRMSGVYWGLSALRLLHKEDLLHQKSIIDWIMACQHENGGFGGSKRQDPHILYTLSAIQILAIYNRLDLLDADRTAHYISSLQQPDGSFFGDQWGEVDTRFSYAALAGCSLLGRPEVLNTAKAADYVLQCQNFDGGFGVGPGDESHTGQVFVCVAALAIADCLHRISPDQLCWWLCERQRPNGGLNGRPEKLEDVCYSWWCLSALQILDRLHWIDKDALVNFILSCQDEVNGGISDRADDECDVYHTFFGIAGLSILGYPGLDKIDPVYALPSSIVDNILSISFERGGFFQKLCLRAFNQCDVDGSGRIDVKELHIGLLILYDKINRVLPIHYPVPSKYEISQLMTEFDKDHSNELTFEEFFHLARFQLGLNKQRWHQSIWFRVVRKWTLKALVWPTAGLGVKKGLITIGMPAGRVPTAVLAFAVEAAMSSIASLQ